MRRFAVAAAVGLAWLPPAAAAHAAAIQRPNPVLTGLTVDYDAPLPAAGGGVASLAPLDPAVIGQAVRDQTFLAYELRGDLGGFTPAPVGQSALGSGGRAVVGAPPLESQIPLFRSQAGGAVKSFAAVAGAPARPAPPANGRVPVPGRGLPGPAPQPAPGAEPPPANQGFGGRPGGGTTTRRPPPPPGTATSATGTTSPPATTTAPPATTAAPPATTTAPRPTPTTAPSTPTTAPAATTTAAATTAPAVTPTTTTTTPPAATTAPATTGGSSSRSCGTHWISISSDLPKCRIAFVDAAPGASTTELLTITNVSDQPYTLSLKVTGPHNSLWRDLEMAVYEDGTPAPAPLPPLAYWEGKFNDLLTLAAGQTIVYDVELYLPTPVGNEDQGLAAVIDLHWHASG